MFDIFQCKMSSEDDERETSKLDNESSPNGLAVVKVEIFEGDELEDSSDTSDTIPQKNVAVKNSSYGSGPSPGPSKNRSIKVSWKS